MPTLPCPVFFPLGLSAIFWITLLNLSIPDVPFPVLLVVLLSTLIKSRFQAKPATLLIPIDFPFLLVVEELYGTRYQSGSFFLIDVGSGFHCLRSFSFLFFSELQNRNPIPILPIACDTVSVLNESDLHPLVPTTATARALHILSGCQHE
jgi:hypothetical protein